MMTERPILFSAPMVRALLAGTKTQTRRIVKPQPDFMPDHGYRVGDALCCNGKPVMCPYGHPGNRLWVRETHVIVGPGSIGYGKIIDGQIARYRATEPDLSIVGGWSPSIYMPRWASRILLEIVAVRVKRLQDISEADAEAEGIETVLVSESDFRYVDYLRAGKRDIGDKEATCGSAVHSYATLWESINGRDSWAANPWVWVIEFKRVAP